MTISTTTGSRVSTSSSAFLSAPPLPLSPKVHVILNKHFTHSSNFQILSIIHSKSHRHHPQNTSNPLLGSTSSAPFVEEEEEDQEDGNVSLSLPGENNSDELIQSESSAVEQNSADLFLSGRGCKACGREEIEGGCNGEGRIQGGIATVPGFGWWPIKAYRPCPAYLATGGRYKRRGQSMDEVASGRIARRVGGDNKANKGKQGPMKFKK